MCDLPPQFKDCTHILSDASVHDIDGLKQCIDTYVFDDCRAVDVQDPSTGDSPLHVAVASCGRGRNGTASPVEFPTLRDAEATVVFLLENGAIWNQLNKKGLTPGCVAFELGLMDLYQLMVDAGVRAELLHNRLSEYDQLNEEEEEEGGEGGGGGGGGGDGDGSGERTDLDLQNGRPIIVVSDASVAVDVPSEITNGTHDSVLCQASSPTSGDVESKNYLSSTLSMTDSGILDEQQNGVMMAWEKGIMVKSADAIMSSPGLRVLNIGFGMGIIDSLIQSHSNKPAEHHIIEAHPDVLKEIKRTGWLDKADVFFHAGRWQEILPIMVNDGLVFDAIYYDTFAESYKDFKDFFSEHLLGLLDSGGRWSYFNGMGADRQISYDIYQKVVEMDLFEAGYDVEWQEVELPDLGLGEWEEVKRRYWNVAKYRLPVCRFMA